MGIMSLTSCRALSTPGKFSNVDRYAQMKTWLLQTGKRYLVEDVFEDFWGVGKEGKGGLNMLGKLWMRIRASLPPPPKSPSSTPPTAQTNPSYKSVLIAPAQKDSRARPDRNKTKADTAPFTVLIGNSQITGIESSKFSAVQNSSRGPNTKLKMQENG